MGSLRIVGGALRGRRILVPGVRGLRPTPDRVREAVFNILGQSFDGERVLDAFAGSGALGLEAISRGAGSVTFVESDRKIAAALREAAEGLGVADRVRIVVGDVVRQLAGGALRGPFDLVLADPPYAGGAGEALLAALAREGCLAPRGRVVLERSSKGRSPGPPEGLELVRTARYGGTTVDFFRGAGGTSGGAP